MRRSAHVAVAIVEGRASHLGKCVRMNAIRLVIRSPTVSDRRQNRHKRQGLFIE